MDDEKPLQDAGPARSIEADLLARMATNGGLSDNTRLKKSGISTVRKKEVRCPAGGGEKHRQRKRGFLLLHPRDCAESLMSIMGLSYLCNQP